MYDIMGKHYD
jgi:phage-related tail protein